jgi:SAM-dependent methyltransferase
MTAPALTTIGLVAPDALVRGGAEHVVSRAYGNLHDFVFERFPPYQALQREILARVARASTRASAPADFRILDLMCGPGSLSLSLADQGFSVLGVEPFPRLLDIARRNVRSRGRPNLDFQTVPVLGDGALPWGHFDQVVNVHSLYAHPAPVDLLSIAYASLKPGGHAIFVNFTRPAPLWSSLGSVARAKGIRAASAALLWLLPNAVFEASRSRASGQNFWGDEEFARRLRRAGFAVLEMRRTFFEDISLLAWARKP